MARSFDAGVYLYPWDVVGDPEAANLIAGLGADHVTLAAVYHATRALTPRHPRHRVVVADHSAAYFPPDGRLWSGAGLRPEPQAWVHGADPFGAATSALAAAGVSTHDWVVVNHQDAPAGADVGAAVVNAYGDRYDWALCPARSLTRDYAVRLAADVAARDGIAGIEFEACGWYGFDHLHAHDKVAGITLNEAEQFLLSLCFCAVCRSEYLLAGIDLKGLREDVRRVLDGRFSGSAGRPDPEASPSQAIETALGPDPARAVLAMRARIADRLRSEVAKAVRDRRGDPDFSVAFHASPQPHRTEANTGLDPAALPAEADGVVVKCWGTPDGAAQTVSLTADAARTGLRVSAGLQGVGGWGATTEGAVATLEAVRSAGASGVRIYHAGLAGSGDLDLIRTLITEAHREL
jgi:hypothetical protein